MEVMWYSVDKRLGTICGFTNVNDLYCINFDDVLNILSAMGNKKAHIPM